MDSLWRERDNHRLPAIASCPHIRQLYDVIEPTREPSQQASELQEEKTPHEKPIVQPESMSRLATPLCLIFEWMDYDLRNLPSNAFRGSSNLPKWIAKAVLEALAVLKSEYGAIHTGAHPSTHENSANFLDINPNNVLVSNAESTSPRIVVSDLGNGKWVITIGRDEPNYPSGARGLQQNPCSEPTVSCSRGVAGSRLLSRV